MNRTLSFLLILLSVMQLHGQSYSGTLPVLFINTENGVKIESKEEYVKATYYLDNVGNAEIESIGASDNQLVMEIRGRGNYSWTGFDKKPYRIKLGEKQPLLGMNKSRHFALLAHADDSYGFFRNIVGFQLSRMIGMPWTPADAPLEVVLNGEYIGLYFLTETVRVDKDRVNIVEQADNITDTEAITGGWLVEIDNYDSDPHIEIYEKDEEKNRIVFTYKTPEILSPEQSAYLTTQMTAINDAIYNENLNDNTWENYVDVDILARYYIVQEIVDDYESFHGSCYMFKELGNDTKWMFGPVWDFGNAFTEDKFRPFYEGRRWHNTWIKQICKHPHFIEVVKEIWAWFYAEKYSELDEYITNYADRISEAAINNAARWPEYGNGNISERLEKVKSRLAKSVAWLNGQWAEKQTYTVTFVDNGVPTWNKVCAYVWYMDGGNAITVLGKWPGMELSKDELTGHYICSFDHAGLPDNTMIIFNNGGSGAGNQTADLDYIDGAKYNRDGVFDGIDVVESDCNDIIEIVDLIGRVRYINATSLDYNNLSPGFYIIDGEKTFVK